jgi:hypothetical protein
MSGDYVIVAVPWLIFAVGLAAIAWRLAASRARGRGQPGAPGQDRPGQPGPADTPPPASRGAPPGARSV